MNAQPHTYPRRILLLVSGMSPQVVTETLFSLTQSSSPAFFPTEVHLISTIRGAEEAQLNLLSGPGHFLRLCSDYGLDPGIFTADNIHVIEDATGQRLADIRLPADNEATADFITKKVRELTADANAALHISIAGGRKTMGYYAGYALSLFGRPQDRLSHVLVDAGYENLQSFYYPTPYSQTIHTRDGESKDAAKAVIHLAEIPFVRLREGFPPTLLSGEHSFNEVIARSQMIEANPALLIDVPQRRLVFHDLVEVTELGAANFAFYAWIAERNEPVSGQAISDMGYHKDYAVEFLDMYKRIVGNPMKTDARVEQAMESGMGRNYFDSTKSDINTILAQRLGERLAKHYCINNLNSKQKGKSLYLIGHGQTPITWKWE